MRGEIVFVHVNHVSATSIKNLVTRRDAMQTEGVEFCYRCSKFEERVAIYFIPSLRRL